jgi:hypothetical protein
MNFKIGFSTLDLSQSAKSNGISFSISGKKNVTGYFKRIILLKL